MFKHKIRIETSLSKLYTSNPDIMRMNFGALKHLNLKLNNNIILTDFDFISTCGKIKSQKGNIIADKYIIIGAYYTATTDKIELEKDVKDRIDLNHVYDIDVDSAIDYKGYPINLAYAHIDVLHNNKIK